MNTFKATAIYIYYLVTKGPKYIRDINTEDLYERLKENPTLEEVKGEFEALHGININALFKCNASLISTAIDYCSDPKITEYIVNQGFDLNPPNDRPLLDATDPLFDSEFDYSDKTKTAFYLEILDILLNAGAHPNHRDSLDSIVNGFKSSPQKTALQKNVLKLCLEHGADLDSQDNKGRSILFFCDEDDEQEIIEFLLKHGANPNITDKEGNTPLQYYYKYLSIRDRASDLVKMYLQYGWNPDNQNNRKQSFLFKAVISDNTKVVNLLLSHKPSLDFIDINGKKVADYAKCNDIYGRGNNIVKLLKEAGAKPVFNELDYQLLKTTYYWRPEKQNINDVKVLLTQGGNINVSNNHMETPLYYAVHAEDEALVKLFLSYQPNLNVIEDQYEQSILHQAAYSDHVNIVALLLEAGADVNIRSSPDEPTAFFHVKSLKMLELFIKHGVDINAKNSEGKTILSKIVTPRGKNGGLIDDEDEFIYDAEGIDKIKLLLKQGIKLAPDEEGNTIFMMRRAAAM